MEDSFSSTRGMTKGASSGEAAIVSWTAAARASRVMPWGESAGSLKKDEDLWDL